ncbi:MAG: MFS transporter [Anaerolineales bacterium]|nr:MFS transporter [Anaerolineales bacterium]
MDYKRLFPILLIVFTNILGAGVIMPILPLYAEGQFNGAVIQITLLSSAFFAAQFLAAPILGRLSDRYGRRPVLIISQIGTVLAFIIFIFSIPLGQWIDSWGLVLPMSGGMFVLFAARILDGITGGNITTAQAYISDVTDAEHRAQGLGLLQAAFGLGFIFGPAFGGILSNINPVAPFIGAAIITSGTLLLTVFTLDESLPAEKRAAALGSKQRGAVPLQILFSNKSFDLVLLIGFFGSLAFAALPAIFALYANHVLFPDLTGTGRVQLYIGLILTFYGLMQVFTQLALLRPLIKRLGERRLIILGEITLFLAMLGIVATGSAIAVTLLLAPFAFGQGVTEPSLQSMVTRFGDESTRGQLLGLYQSSRSLALIVGPIWAGLAYANIDPQAVFVIGSGIIFCALVCALILSRQQIPSPHQELHLEHPSA